MEPSGAKSAARRLRTSPPDWGENTRARDTERDALLRVAAAAAGAYDLPRVIELVALEAREAVNAASLSISHWDREHDALRTLINVGELGPGEETHPVDELLPLGSDSHARRLLREGQPFFSAVDDPQADPEATARLRAVCKESELGVPVVVEGEVWGEVYATTAQGQPRFRGEDVRFLEAVAGQLAVALTRAELFSRVSRLAYEDSLTGLANRRALEERLDRAVARAGARERGLAVLLCDLDDLKTINDSAGHDAGDRALCMVADSMVAAAASRPGNLVGRLAGDEFCVVMEGASVTDARRLAASTIEQLTEQSQGSVSISCGAAVLGPGVEDRAQLLRAADAALYQAKRSITGRVWSAGAAGAAGEPAAIRRWRRGTTRDSLRGAVEELVRRFEHELASSPGLERVEAVGMAMAGVLNASVWAVSFVPAGSGRLHTLVVADGRDHRVQGLRLEINNDAYEVADYPATKRVVEAGSGAFIIRREDPTADPAERALLEYHGRHAVLAAAASDHDGTWFLEVYSDERSEPLEEGLLDIGLLVQAAVPRRPVGGGGGSLLERRSRELQLTSALGGRLAGEIDPERIVAVTVEEIHTALGVTACAILRRGFGDVLELIAGAGRLAPHGRPMVHPSEKGLLGRCLREDRPVLVGDVTREPDYHPSPAGYDIASELVVPVKVDQDLWGVITLEDTREDAFDEEDMRLIGTVAAQLGAALRSAELYARLDRAYLGTAEALSAALEAKDSYTAAHSRSLVRHAELVGRRLGMPADQIRSLRYAAAFHDIGKLAVPEAILHKAGPLTEEERLLVERHTVIGEQILLPVEFLSDVLPLVRSAHERWDGQGYPDRLIGDAIPLGARIIFASDTFDAMTTDRPYRAALAVGEARDELLRCSGSQLDPRVVEALLDVLG